MAANKKAPARKTKPKASAQKRKPAQRSRAGAPKAKVRSSAAPRRRASASKQQALSPLQVDLTGLGLIVLGTFMAAVIWGGWSGGPVGRGLEAGFRILVGQLVVLAPIALISGGFMLIARETIPLPRKSQVGVGLLLASACLVFTSGTFGLGGDAAPGWTTAALKANGGAVGQGLYAALSAAVGDVGTHLVAVFMVAAGLLLISGVSLSWLFDRTVSSVSDATKALSSAASSRTQDRQKPQPKASAKADPVERLLPPEPDPEELVVKATHVEAGAPPEHLDDEDSWSVEGDNEPSSIGIDEALDELDEVVAISSQDSEDDSGDDSDETSLTPMGRYRSATTDDPNFKWKQPPKSLLVRSPKVKKNVSSDQSEIATRLVESLGHHGVVAEIVGTVSGPHITRFELKLAPGTKVSKVSQLRDDLAYALASTDIRILAPIPGKQAVGVEVPNEERQMVTLGDVWQAPPEGWSPLTVWLGKDVAGRSIGADLAKMPHLLVAGTTGAGKSGCVNAMLSSVLLRATPRDVKLVLVDPKQVELNHYESVPHLMTPVITNPRQAANALANLVREMEQRYALMAISRTRGLVELNESRERRGEPKLPYILCVIDELADLMMVAPTEVEDAIIRLAQKARAVGIHLVLATQSPRVDVITGMIKANVPSRIAFAVSSQTDSRVILDQNGAETLLGQGDMLFAPVGSSKLQRIQGAYIDEAQIAELCEYWRAQGEPNFNAELLEEVIDEDSSGGDSDEFDPDEDALLEEAITLVAQMQTASTSMMQRRLRVGYTRAGRLIDMLERRGVISGYEGSKPRQVLITEADLPRILAQLSSTEPAQASLDVGDDV